MSDSSLGLLRQKSETPSLPLRIHMMDAVMRKGGSQMRKYFVVAVIAGVLVVGTSLPATGAATHGADVAVAKAQADTRAYVDDKDDFLYYRSTSSTSTCGGNPACDIEATGYSVSRDEPDDLYVVAVMAGPTDAELTNSDKGSMGFLVDSDGDTSNWEFGMWTVRAAYPLKKVVYSWVYAWDGDSWEQTEFVGAWYRSDTAWVAFIPWKDLGITSARLAVRSADAAGNLDYSPSQDGTPVIPIAALVAGAPGQPTGLTATPGMGQVSLSWKAPVTTGTSAITSYTVTASPGGATCTSASTSCTVTGLTGGSTYSFSVTATNAQGTGPASDPASATPGASTPSTPTNLKATYKAKGGKSTATVTWTRPAGVTSMQVRWALNGGAWSPWKPVKVDKIAVPGLVKGKTTSFEVRGVNAGGPGAVASLTLSPK